MPCSEHDTPTMEEFSAVKSANDTPSFTVFCYFLLKPCCACYLYLCDASDDCDLKTP